jgi:hypothetical protein
LFIFWNTLPFKYPQMKWSQRFKSTEVGGHEIHSSRSAGYLLDRTFWRCHEEREVRRHCSCEVWHQAELIGMTYPIGKGHIHDWTDLS